VTVERNKIKTTTARFPGLLEERSISNEAEPGPLYSRGISRAGMKDRNIAVQLPKE
jgi:hypothetical protein